MLNLESKAKSKKNKRVPSKFSDVKSVDIINEEALQEAQLEQSTQVNNIDVSGVEDFSNMFNNETSNPSDNVKELFKEDKVKTRTELTKRQVKQFTKAYYLADITGMPEIKGLLDNFLKLQISKDRKSRIEFVDGLKAKLDNMVATSGNLIRGQFNK